MLRPVGEPRRIDRAIRRLQGALKGVPARGVRLTWRGGELRTTIHWARDDSFWWAFEPRTARQALLLGHAPDAPTRRESITCEINLPRIADRKVAGIIAADDAGALYLAHSGRMGGTRLGQRKSGFREFLADGVWRRLTWPDGEDTEALIVAPLDSPRLTRLLGQFVDAVRHFKAGDPPSARTGLCVEPALVDLASAACDRRLVDGALHEELARRGLFGGADDLFSLRGERPQPLFALVADGGPRSWRWRWARCRSPRRAAAPTCGRSWWRPPRSATATMPPCRRCLCLRALPLARRPGGVRWTGRRVGMKSWPTPLPPRVARAGKVA